jgi:hypothetical protein
MPECGTKPRTAYSPVTLGGYSSLGDGGKYGIKKTAKPFQWKYPDPGKRIPAW